MDFEKLPDEILLEICRFLSSTDILYSLFNLNSRLNRTISLYRQHVRLRQTSFNQFEYICLNILPQIGLTIRSLSLNANWTDLLPERFHFYFGDQMKEIFPNLEDMTLVAFNGNELNNCIESISDLPYLNKLIIQDRYNVTEEYKQILFEKILSANQNRLKTVIFNRHSESLIINPNNPRIYSNIIKLSIHLDKIIDLRYLLKLIPNICQLNVVINKHSEVEIIEFEEILMKNLIEFHLESSRRSWCFSEIRSLLKQMPFLTHLSLDIFSPDVCLLDGEEILSILPTDTLQHLNYMIKYTSEEQIDFIDNIISSWILTPYSICCLVEDSQTHMFLHTIPYGFAFLEMNSVFFKHMKKETDVYRYHIKDLLLFNISTLAETFLVIKNCNRMKDLDLILNDTTSTIENGEENKSRISLPRLNHLHLLSIDGYPSDGYLMKDILSVAPNLCILIIDMKFLLQLIDLKDNQSCTSLLENRIQRLSIDISDETDLNDTNIQRLSNIFPRLRHLIIKSHISNMSIENILLLFLNHFQNHRLISLIIRGLTTEELRTNPSQWLIDHTYLKEFTDKFQAVCDEIEFRIWL